VRSARILISGPLDDRQPSGIEDLLEAGQSRMEAERVTAAIASDLQNVRRRHVQRRTPAVVEAVVVGHERAERVVPARQVQDDEVAARRSLRAREIAEKGRRREADGKGGDAAAHELASGYRHPELP
jgi:hypothetical protein